MEGYYKIAQLMSEHPEFAILRQFRRLNMQNLLYLQAEITHLEDELREMATQDRHQRDYMKDWWALSQSEEDAEHWQWSKVLEVRRKLDEYNDALLKQRELLSMRPVVQQNLEFLQQWMERPSMGAFPLIGLDRKSWDVHHISDLVMVAPSVAKDPFAQWVEQSALPGLHRLIGRRFKQTVSHELGHDLYEYKDNVLSIVMFGITAVIAALVPLCSVLLLYLVQSTRLRLGIIVALSVVFSLALAVMTDARKIEIFAATSAFAAVNVVWASNNTS